MIIEVYLDDRTLSALADASAELGRTVEDLAEAAVQEAALKYQNSRLRPAELGEG